MATAVAEKSKPKAPQYAMPRPKPGMFVRWYAGGNPADTWRGLVRKVYQDTVEIHVLGLALGPRRVCRHVSDPNVQKTGDERPEYIKETGLWDFTEEHYDDLSWRKSVCDRLELLELQCEQLEANAKKGK